MKKLLTMIGLGLAVGAGIGIGIKVTTELVKVSDNFNEVKGNDVNENMENEETIDQIEELNNKVNTLVNTAIINNFFGYIAMYGVVLLLCKGFEDRLNLTRKWQEVDSRIIRLNDTVYDLVYTLTEEE